MPTRKRKLVTLRSTNKRKNRWWGILFVFAVLLAAIWILISVIFTATVHWTAGVTETQVVALVSSSDQSGSTVIALLDPDEMYSKIVLTYPKNYVGLLMEPWEIASVAGVLVNRVIQVDDADFSTSQAVAKSVRTGIVQSLKAGKWQVARQLLTISKILSQKGLVEVDDAQSATAELTVLGRMGEACPIGVANTTSVSGVASKYANLVTSQGGLVVRITNQDAQIQDTLILIDDQLVTECNAVAQLIKNALPATMKIEIQSGIYSRHRVGVLVLIGQNAVEQL